MQFAGEPSWMMSEDSDRAVLAALYLRDLLDIRPPLDLPRLTPEVTVAEHARTLREQHVLEHQWVRWWATVVEPKLNSWRVPLTLVPLGGLDTALPTGGLAALTDALIEYGGLADDWAQSAMRADAEKEDGWMARGDGLQMTNLVAQRELEIGRRARPFRLQVRLAPLAAPGIWWIGEQTVAVARSIRHDPDAMAEAMHPILERIV